MSKENQNILSMVPKSATRVKVQDEHGEVVWRKLQEVLPSDSILLSPAGFPYVMKADPGRRNVQTKIAEARAVTHVVQPKRPLLDIPKPELCIEAERNPESADLLNKVMVELANEAASLALEREEAERRGLDTVAFTTRRISALKSLADTWIKRKNQGGNSVIDLESDAFRVLFQFIMATFRDCMEQCGTRGEVIETVFTNFSSKISDEWMAEARARMKNAASE